MYSDDPEEGAIYHFDFRDNRCGSSRAEGDCFNREHSLPRSWFKGTKLLESDLFHLYPTDGYVNNRRSNLPFGEAGITYWESSNGSKVGQNTFGNYTKTIFEPIDEYKGDFARTYFYVVTAYEDKVPQWRSDQVGGSRYPGFSDWSLSLLLKWHREDPVSLKEVRRNEEVYRIQDNRNPYIDYPELAEYVWGESISEIFQPDLLSDSFLVIECSPFERWLKGMSSLFKQR
jgi:endonuclease I